MGSGRDAKLSALVELLAKKHPAEKVLVFYPVRRHGPLPGGTIASSRFQRPRRRDRRHGQPDSLAWRFSPVSNNKTDRIQPQNELRVLVATDVLTEGQNLQDCAIVVNYDLPWAIIRLIQRAGRVDRIGQKAEEILCYSFFPADGVERIIRLRARVRTAPARKRRSGRHATKPFSRIKPTSRLIRDLFTEKSGILDETDDDEVDLASLAYQIWKNAMRARPRAAPRRRSRLPDVVFSTKALSAPLPNRPGGGSRLGVMVYVRTAEGNDALA